MARMARLVHDLIRQAFAKEGDIGDLHAHYTAFQQVLITDLSVDQFADMYAQTITYGLFAARCNHIGPGFTREQAGHELPKTNPFLRRSFNTIAGRISMTELHGRLMISLSFLRSPLLRPFSQTSGGQIAARTPLSISTRRF